MFTPKCQWGKINKLINKSISFNLIDQILIVLIMAVNGYGYQRRWRYLNAKEILNYPFGFRVCKHADRNRVNSATRDAEFTQAWRVR